MSREHLWDVVAVNIDTATERVMDRNMTALNAEAYIEMAVRRRGVEEEFYKAVPSNTEPST